MWIFIRLPSNSSTRGNMEGIMRGEFPELTVPSTSVNGWPSHWNPQFGAPPAAVLANHGHVKLRELQTAVQPTRTVLETEYHQKAKALDLRYATFVHGEYKGPWKDVWSDDPTEHTHNRAYSMERALMESFTRNVNKGSESAIRQLSADDDIEGLKAKRAQLAQLVPHDTLSSRLSNAVLSTETDAVSIMRNFAYVRLRRARRTGSSYEHQIAVDHLDLVRYGNIAETLHSSLRRDDLTYLPFARLVGLLLLQSTFMTGRAQTSITWRRPLQDRINRAATDAVACLIELPRQIKINDIQLPLIETLFTDETVAAPHRPAAARGGAGGSRSNSPPPGGKRKRNSQGAPANGGQRPKAANMGAAMRAIARG